MSPELFDPEIQDHRLTKWSDCYALGMVIYEVLSGHIPFDRFPTWVISGKVFRGDRPERPQGAKGVWFTDEVWEVLGFCWTPQPENRPSIEDVLQCLDGASGSWEPLSPHLSVVLSIADSLARGPSSVITVESMDVSNTSPLYQPSEKPGQEESVGIANQVSWVSS